MSKKKGFPISPALYPREYFTRDQLIIYYAQAGLSTSVIKEFLCSKHGYNLSTRQIRRIRKANGVSQSEESSFEEICCAIEVIFY